jgi:hypothetical protein
MSFAVNLRETSSERRDKLPGKIVHFLLTAGCVGCTWGNGDES